jgi:hypothetical protein
VQLLLVPPFRSEHALRAVGEVLAQHLERDITPEMRIASAVDLTHPAGTEAEIIL